jgi:TonB family protein
VPLGSPSGRSDSTSGGPGSGGGLGKGTGPGVGDGRGPGSGRGSGGGLGNGIDRGEPGGDNSGAGRVNWGQFPTGYVPFRWLFRPTPVTTPEAQLNRVTGDVLLRADFNANGTITNIDVVNPVEYMTESAIESVRRSRFKPATVDGKPISLLRVPIVVKVHY